MAIKIKATERIKALLSNVGSKLTGVKNAASNTAANLKQDYQNFSNKLESQGAQAGRNFKSFVSDNASSARSSVSNFLNTPVRVSPTTARVASRLASATPTKIIAPSVQSFKDWQAKPSNQMVKTWAAKPMGPISQRLADSGVLNPVNILKKFSQQMAPSDMGQRFSRDFSPIIGEPAAESIGYGIQGATSLTPFRLANLTSQDYRTKLKEAGPTTERQQKSERIGRMLYGTLLTAPLGGPNPYLNVASRGLQGSTLSLGLKGAETLIGEGRLPTLNEAGEAATTGLENSWMLAFTNLATDKILGAGSKYLPGLNKIVGGNTTAPLKILGNANLMNLSNPTKVKILTTAGMRLFSRALAEVPMENTFFTAMEGFTPEEKADFTQRWWNNLPGNIAGNLLFAGLQLGGGGTYNWNKKEIDGAVEALKKTLSGMKPGYARLDLGMGKDDKLSTDLQKAKPRYNYGQKAFVPEFKSDVDKALYITAQTKKSASDDSYRNYLKNVIGMTDDEIAAAGKEVRDFVKSQAKVAEGGTQSKPEIIIVPDQGVKTAVEQPITPTAPTAPVTTEVPQAPVEPALKDIGVKTPQEGGLQPEEVKTLTDIGVKSVGEDTLAAQIKKAGDDLGQIRKDLKAETDPSIKQVLMQEEARLKQDYADLKNLQEGKGYAPAEAITAAETPKQAVETITQTSPEIKTTPTEGFTQAAEAKMKAPRKPKIITPEEEVKKPGILKRIKSKLNEIFSPVKNLTTDVETATRQLDAGHKLASFEANQTEINFAQISKESGISPELEWKLVQYAQEPTKEVADILKITPEEIAQGAKLIEAHKVFNDQIFEEAKTAGVDIKYLKDHVLQIYKESRPDIAARLKAKGLSTKPGFSKKKVIENYREAIGVLGLTPRYTTFGQINAAMQEQLGKSMANQNYVDALKGSGQLKPASKAPHEWETITAPGFPTVSVKISPTKSVELSYKAEPKLARFLNNYFGGQPQGLASELIEGTANIAKLHQDIKLSGGIKTINAFTVSQFMKDMATSLGDILTLHPVRGVKRASNSFMAVLRDFIPGASTRFEKAETETMRQMASTGIEYSGEANYKITRKNIAELDNVLQKVAKGGKNIWKNITDNPTFRHMMWQRKVGQFKMYRDSFLKSGMDLPTAVQMAAKELKTYEGVADSMGRSQDLENSLSTLLLAPKYREGVIGSQVNAIRSIFDWKDKTKASSRSLAIGLVGMYALYNELNKVYNKGKNLWENPQGKEFSLVIPKNQLDPNADPNEYYHFPWMPGYTATARNAVIGTTALLRGDTKEAGKQFAGFGATWLQTAKEMSSGEDYFGRELFDPNKARLPQQIQHGITSSVPGPIRELTTYTKAASEGKDPSGKLAILRALELPIKEGKFSSQYFNVRDDIMKGQDKKTKDGYDFLHPTKEAWELTAAADQSGASSSEQDRMTKANIRLQNPNIFMLEKEIALKTGETLGKEVDPLYKVSMETAMRYLRYQSLPIGNGDKSALGKMYPEIYELAAIRGDFFERNPIPGAAGPNRPIPSDRVQKLMDAGNWTDPEVKSYLDANDIYKNQEREKLGLPPLAGYGGWGSKEKKISIKVPTYKTPMLKLAAPSKLKIKLPTISSYADVVKAPTGIKSSYTPKKIKLGSSKKTKIKSKMTTTLRGIGRA